MSPRRILVLLGVFVLLAGAGLGARAIGWGEALPPGEAGGTPLAPAVDREEPALPTPAVNEVRLMNCPCSEPEQLGLPAEVPPAAVQDPRVQVPGKPPAPKVPDKLLARVPDKSPTFEGLRIKRRDKSSEEELRRQLATIPEETLKKAELPRLVEKYAANYTASRGRNLEPTPLLGMRPDFKQLPVIQGDSCRLSPGAAARLTVLSQKLHRYLDDGAPKDATGRRSDPVLLCERMRLETRGKKPEWLRPEAIPTLRQLLMFEDRPLRMMLVELLQEIPGIQASLALAMEAVFDLSPEVRAAAVTALGERPRDEYRAVLLRGLRYPWPPAADHAAEALVALQDREAVPQLIDLLEKPEPNTPYLSNKNHLVVQELVQINHQFNCLMCHAPAVTTRDPVPGLVPEVTVMTSTTSGGGGGYGGRPPSPAVQTMQSRPLWIRADVAYLRQDFSFLQPTPIVLAGRAMTTNLRFDYLVRTRPLTDKETKRFQAEHKMRGESRQRLALLYTLRELAGEERGSSFEDWKELAAAHPKIETEAKALADQLANAPAARQPSLLARLRDGQGPAYTKALARVVPKLAGAAKNNAREALAARLSQLRTSDLREKLQDDNQEIRRGAIVACVRKEDKALVPDLIALVEDRDASIARLACQSLEGLTGQSIGVSATATALERFEAASAWKAWWKKESTERHDTAKLEQP